MKRGTLVEWSSWGNGYRGFIVGEASYDNAGADNAYVARYVWTVDDDAPRHPYAVVEMDYVRPAKKKPKKAFCVGAGWSASPRDRCNEWDCVKDKETGNWLIVPLSK